MTSARQAPPILSEREKSVLEWVTLGKRDIEIAVILGLSISTVRASSRKIRLKMEACGRATLIVAGGHVPCARGENGLSKREAEVIAHASRGWTDARIARELGVAVKTVSKHMEHVLEKLQVESRYAAIAVSCTRAVASAG